VEVQAKKQGEDLVGMSGARAFLWRYAPVRRTGKWKCIFFTLILHQYYTINHGVLGPFREKQYERIKIPETRRFSQQRNGWRIFGGVN